MKPRIANEVFSAPNRQFVIEWRDAHRIRDGNKTKFSFEMILGEDQSIAFNYLKTYAVGLTVYWQLLLGAVLIVLVLALPTGIMGSMNRLALKIRGMSSI